MSQIIQMRREGLSISQISALTGFDRKTIRKYLNDPTTPRYGPRKPATKRAGILAPYTDYIHERLAAGVWNAVVLFAELKARGYPGGYTVVKDYLRPRRQQARQVAVRRFETPPGQQAQVDWCELGRITFPDATTKRLYGFVMTLAYSRALFCQIVTDCKLSSFLRLHEAAFSYLGGVPQEILYDRVKTVVLGLDERAEIKWQSTFLDFAGHFGFVPRLCRAYRPQTKGKVENGIGYIRKNFLCGRDANDVSDLNAQMLAWLSQVANLRVHGTTYRPIHQAWQEEKAHLLSAPQAAYPLVLGQLRKVSRDGYVAYQSNRYSVPWQAAGQEVMVAEEQGKLKIIRAGCCLCIHDLCSARHQTVTVAAHHSGIPLGSPRSGKARLELKLTAPRMQVEVRPLSVYAALLEEKSACAPF